MWNMPEGGLALSLSKKGCFVTKISRKKKIILSILAANVIALAGLWLAGEPDLFTLNTTKSIPLGLYRLTHKDTDPLAVFCATGEQFAVATARGYLAHSHSCENNFMPMIKPIVARPGDTVTVSQNGISVNGSLLPNSRAEAFDHLHRPLEAWPNGTYHVMQNTVWVVSSYSEHSFDSRYFGPISTRLIQHHAHPIWQVNE
jgi:conjugative transfer signal peptidase TraF